MADAKTKTVTEFVLKTGAGDTEQGVFSHASESVVRHKADSLTVAAIEGGRVSPEFTITKRVCSYPLDGEGRPQGVGSKVVETVLLLALAIAACAMFAVGDGGAFLVLAGVGAVPGFRGRGQAERVNFILGQALNVGGSTPFAREFKMGAGWYRMWLRIAVTVVIGTGTTPLSEGLLRFVRKIMFKTDRGELISNIGARPLFYIDTYHAGARPQIDTLAASNGTYVINLFLPFVDENMKRPEDTVLDTSRYQSMDLELQLGTVADLFGVVGTSSVTATLDVDVERSFGVLPPEAKPFYFVSYDNRPPQDASVNPNIELEKSQDLSIKRLFLFTGDTGTAGVPWSGNANDTYPQRTNLQDQDRFIEKDRKHPFVQAVNKLDARLETVMAGVEVYDFVSDRSINGALSTADKSSLQLLLTQSGAAASSIMTLTHEGIRLLKS